MSKIWRKKKTCIKTKENMINWKINGFDVEYRIYFTRQKGLFNILIRAYMAEILSIRRKFLFNQSHSCKYYKSCLTHEKLKLFSNKITLKSRRSSRSCKISEWVISQTIKPFKLLYCKGKFPLSWRHLFQLKQQINLFISA